MEDVHLVTLNFFVADFYLFLSPFDIAYVQDFVLLKQLPDFLHVIFLNQLNQLRLFIFRQRLFLIDFRLRRFNCVSSARLLIRLLFRLVDFLFQVYRFLNV